MTRRDLTCEEVMQQLFAYLDREVDERNSDAIERHLAKCRDCFSRTEFERRLRARVAAATTVKAPRRLHRRIEDLLDRFDTDETDSTT